MAAYQKKEKQILGSLLANSQTTSGEFGAMTTSKAYNIIVVEPDPVRRNYLRMQILDREDTAICFEKESICLDNLALLAPDLVILGQLPNGRISRFLYAAKYIDIRLPVLVVSAEPETRAFIRANGFANILGVSPSITPEALKEAIGQFKARGVGLSDRKGAHDWPIIVGTDPEVVKLKKAIFKIACSDEALLVEGESGTGKDLVARAVHFWSTRHQGSFIKVDSGSITQEIIQSDHSIGFESEGKACQQSGSNKNRGLDLSRQTLFFDEIGQTPFALQGILLRLFEQQGGAGNPSLSGTPCIRIIASTSQNLASLVEMGKFRKDLFYRLNVFRIRIPPLRERPMDIPPLVDFFIDKYCHQLGKGHYRLPQKARALYAEYNWPGNARELENIVKSSVVVGDGNGYIESLCRCCNSRKNAPAASEQGGSLHRLADFGEIKSHMIDLNSISLKGICSEFITQAEKKFMKKALDRTNWNRKKAAGLLNISYKSLLNKIKVYNLTA